MIRVTSLTKNYGTLRALDHLDLHVDDGEIVGFVGANGAGKSTTMRIIMGSLISDEGEVLWIKDGQQVPIDAYHRRLVGYMPEERGLYPKMKVADQLTYLARLHGLSRHEATSAANSWMERLAVEQRAGDEVQKLSLGNQQRVQLAAALVSDPELLVLDEPFSGLDPVAVDVMSEVLRERAQAGVGTLFSSHQLDVVERLCDRVVIIRSGKLVADGTVAYAGALNGYGNTVVIDYGDGYTGVYTGLSSIAVGSGGSVKTGGTIGTSGSLPSGEQGLYFEIRYRLAAMNPAAWLR